MTTAASAVMCGPAVPSPSVEPGRPQPRPGAVATTSAPGFPVPGTHDLRLTDVPRETDPGFDAADRRETLRRAVAVLPVRERRVAGPR